MLFLHPSLTCPLIAFCIRFASGLIPSPFPALNFKRLKRLVSPESLIKLMEYFHAYVCLPAVPTPPPPAPSSRHVLRCHGTSLFSRVLRVAKAFGNASNSFASFHSAASVGSLWKLNYARKTGLINRIIAPRANVFVFFCSLFSIFLTRLLSFAFFELSCMIFDFCLSLHSSMVAFHLLSLAK